MTRFNCLPLELRGAEKAAYLKKLGVSQGGLPRLLPRMEALCVQAEGVDPRAAGILKQDMLSLGGDVALPDSVSRFRPERVRLLLMGTRRHYRYLAQGLRAQPYELKALGREIADCLERMGRAPSLLVRGEDLFGRRLFLLMGILNVTPDSFSDGGLYLDPAAAAKRAEEMAREGADILDIGAESTRPSSDPVDSDVELRRLLPSLRAVRSALPSIPISIDTTKAAVAKAALDEGADFVNDVSAASADPEMLPLAASRRAPIVLMHSRGEPKTMQDAPFYEEPVREVVSELRSRVGAAEEAGLGEGALLVDPGIGFGKRPLDNASLLSHLEALACLGHPVLVGISRKSFIGHLTGASVGERLPGSLSLAAAALLRGARVFRVHDVKEHRQALDAAAALLSEGAGADGQ